MLVDQSSFQRKFNAVHSMGAPYDPKVKKLMSSIFIFNNIVHTKRALYDPKLTEKSTNNGEW